MTSATEIKDPKKARREVCFTLITVIISTLFCLLLAEYGLRWYQQSINNSSAGDPGLLRYDAQLGWTLTPSWQGRHQHHDFDAYYSINSHGFRGNFPTNLHRNTKTRIAIVGDSFSFGLGVNDEEVFTAMLNQQQSKVEFLNLSVPGYSTDQQLLLIEETDKKFAPDSYLLMIYLGNDMLDNMRSYPLQVEQAKPYFVLDGDNNLHLENVPVPHLPKPAALRTDTINTIIFGDSLKSFQSKSLLNYSQIWRLFSPVKASAADEAIVFNILDQRLVEHKMLMIALLTQLNDYLTRHARHFRIGLLSGRSYILAPDSYSAYFQEYSRQFLGEVAAQLEIPVIDVADKMRKLSSSTSNRWYYPNEGHLNEEGHRIVSEIVADGLKLGE